MTGGTKRGRSLAGLLHCARRFFGCRTLGADSLEACDSEDLLTLRFVSQLVVVYFGIFSEAFVSSTLTSCFVDEDFCVKLNSTVSSSSSYLFSLWEFVSALLFIVLDNSDYSSSPSSSASSASSSPSSSASSSSSYSSSSSSSLGASRISVISPPYYCISSFKLFSTTSPYSSS